MAALWASKNMQNRRTCRTNETNDKLHYRFALAIVFALTLEMAVVARVSTVAGECQRLF